MTILDINYKHKPMLLVQNRKEHLQKKISNRKKKMKIEQEIVKRKKIVPYWIDAKV